MRPETGPMQFGEDWPGVFIRGKHALHSGTVLAAVLRSMTPEQIEPYNLGILMGLADDLLSCEQKIVDPRKIQNATMLPPVVIGLDPRLRR